MGSLIEELIRREAVALPGADRLCCRIKELAEKLGRASTLRGEPHLLDGAALWRPSASARYSAGVSCALSLMVAWFRCVSACGLRDTARRDGGTPPSRRGPWSAAFCWCRLGFWVGLAGCAAA